MYRLSESLAREILLKIKSPEMESIGPDAFTPKNLNSIGIADATCAIGTDFRYILEAPINIIYPELPYVPVGVKGWFLYRNSELSRPTEPWMVTKMLIDPNIADPEEQIDCAECSIVLPSDVEKLTCQTIGTMEKLIEKEPLILDCLNL